MNGRPWVGDHGWETMVGDHGWETMDGRPWKSHPTRPAKTMWETYQNSVLWFLKIQTTFRAAGDIQFCGPFGGPKWSLLDPKSIRNLMKNLFDFCCDFEPLFSILERFWLQNSLQNEGSRDYFFSIVTNMREV